MCDNLTCVITDENIYKGRPLIVSNSGETAELLLNVDNLQDCELFIVDEVVTTLCIPTSDNQLDCNSTNISITIYNKDLIDQYQLINFIPILKTTSDWKLQNLGNGENLYIFTYNLKNCPLILNNDNNSIVAFESPGGGLENIYNRSLTLKGCVRKCQKKCDYDLKFPLHDSVFAPPECSGMTVGVNLKELVDCDSEFNICPEDLLYTWTVDATEFISGANNSSSPTCTLEDGPLSNNTCDVGLVTYIITPQTEDGLCKGETFTYSVTVYGNELSVTIEGPETICEGETACYEAIVKGGKEPFIYNWDINGFSILPEITTIGDGEKIIFELDAAATGGINLLVTDDCGVTGSSTINVEVFDAPEVELKCGDICIDKDKNFLKAELIGCATAGTPPYIYDFLKQGTENDEPKFQWVRSAGSDSFDEGKGIAVDCKGNSYVTGFFQNTATFDGMTVSSTESRDIFVAKYDTSGVIEWVKSAGGDLEDEGLGIAVDDSGNSYITGYFFGIVDFDGMTVNSISDDIFVAKYDTSGTIQWVKSAVGTSFDRGNEIAVDKNGNSYITGCFNNTATFDGMTILSTGDDDIFIAKYDTNGTIQWVKSAGGSLDDQGFGIDVDDDGNSYITGFFQGTATFDDLSVTSNENNDIFVAKYDTSGNIKWLKSAGGSFTDNGLGIGVDKDGNSYITGYFIGIVDFDGMTVNSISDDIFIAKYDTNGTIQWVKSAGGIGGNRGQGISVDKNGNSYVCGYFQGTAMFDSISITSTENRDIFIAKYETDGNILWVKSAGGISNDEGLGIAVNEGNIYLTGYFRETAIFDDINVSTNTNADIFIAKLSNYVSTIVTSDNQTDPIEVMEEGDYKLIVTDQNCCKAEDTKTIENPCN